MQAHCRSVKRPDADGGKQQYRQPGAFVRPQSGQRLGKGRGDPVDERWFLHEWLTSDVWYQPLMVVEHLPDDPERVGLVGLPEGTAEDPAIR